MSRGPSKGAVSAQEAIKVHVTQSKLSRIVLVARPKGNSHTDVLFFGGGVKMCHFYPLTKRASMAPLLSISMHFGYTRENGRLCLASRGRGRVLGVQGAFDEVDPGTQGHA